MNNKINTIVIVMDELISYHRLPESLLSKLKGYNAFKKIGIEFTNIYNNRQACSPSRSSFLTSVIDTGVQDNIDQSYQYNTVPNMSQDADTIAKIYKQNGNYITAYYGKSHIDSKLATTVYSNPEFNTNTRGAMNIYGFDTFSTFGDIFYFNGYGLYNDNREYESIVPPNSEQYDFLDKRTGQKYSGVIPFLKKRSLDKKNFHMQYHIDNPHDTSHFIQNYSNNTQIVQMQYTSPFLKEQTQDLNLPDPFAFNNDFEDAYIKNKNLTENYFEKTYYQYKTVKTSMPFLQSYNADYVIDPIRNSIFPSFAGNVESFICSQTYPNNKDDIKSWKNLINNYYGLIIEADTYVYGIFQTLKKLDLLNTTAVIITSDHGDQMSAHGLKQKGFLFNESSNVAFLIYSPNLDTTLRNTKSNILGSLLDLNPTIEIISKLQNKSTKFLGTSLLKWNDDKLVIANQAHINYNALHIVNGTMFLNTYPFYVIWYNQQTLETKQRVVRKPKNYFEYLVPFVMTIVKHNNKQYKFARYFSTLEVIRYNIKYNTKLANFKIDLNKIADVINSRILRDDVQTLVDFITGIQNKSFENIYQRLNSNDSAQLYLFMAFVMNQISALLDNVFMLPGHNQTYTELSNNAQYAFFCYNETGDPNEIVNLADINKPNRHNNALFNALNQKLNDALTNYNINSLVYILPFQPTITMAIILKQFGSNLAEYTNEQSFILASMAGDNNSDAKFTTTSIRDIYIKLFGM
jgi:arylsulfatase A-like enzyme